MHCAVLHIFWGKHSQAYRNATLKTSTRVKFNANGNATTKYAIILFSMFCCALPRTNRCKHCCCENWQQYKHTWFRKMMPSMVNCLTLTVKYFEYRDEDLRFILVLWSKSSLNTVSHTVWEKIPWIQSELFKLDYSI